jgi:cation diffusion facilitator CzcD-associated flavoprotein CzcO
MGMIPVLSQLLRTIVFLGAEVEWPLFGSSLYGRLSHRYKSKRLVRFMKRSVPEKYHGILEPKYKLYCKRIIYDARWFKSLNDPKLRLTTKKFTSVTSDGIILGPGHHTVDKVTGETSEAEHVPADIIILANGFRTAEWLMTLNIIGKQSKTLHKVWEERGGAQAYQVR